MELKEVQNFYRFLKDRNKVAEYYDSFVSSGYAQTCGGNLLSFLSGATTVQDACKIYRKRSPLSSYALASSFESTLLYMDYQNYEENKTIEEAYDFCVNAKGKYMLVYGYIIKILDVSELICPSSTDREWLKKFKVTFNSYSIEAHNPTSQQITSVLGTNTFLGCTQIKNMIKADNIFLEEEEAISKINQVLEDELNKLKERYQNDIERLTSDEITKTETVEDLMSHLTINTNELGRYTIKSAPIWAYEDLSACSYTTTSYTTSNHF